MENGGGKWDLVVLPYTVFRVLAGWHGGIDGRERERERERERAQPKTLTRDCAGNRLISQRSGSIEPKSWRKGQKKRGLILGDFGRSTMYHRLRPRAKNYPPSSVWIMPRIDELGVWFLR